MAQEQGRLKPAAVAIATAVAALLQFSIPAEAHGRRAGWFVGGVVIGAALAPRYVHPAPVYYRAWPHLYYAPPPVVYSAPTVVYTAPPAVVAPPPIVYAPPPASAAPPVQPLSIEERLRRLRNLCNEGLFTAYECAERREQILREL